MISMMETCHYIYSRLWNVWGRPSMWNLNIVLFFLLYTTVQAPCKTKTKTKVFTTSNRTKSQSFFIQNSWRDWKLFQVIIHIQSYYFARQRYNHVSQTVGLFFHQNTFNTRRMELALPCTEFVLTQLRHWVYRHKVLLYHFSTENSEKEECANFS